MFASNSYDEANKIKSNISKILIGKNEDVVSVATEKEFVNGKIVYSVKIGLKENSILTIFKILEQLTNEGMISNDCIAHTDISTYSNVFKQEGQIVSHEISASDNTTPSIQSKLKWLTNLFNKNKILVRPVSPGISVGHINVSAGTVGAVVSDQKGNNYILSNNHVLADTNKGKKGDPIIQPGCSDGGTEEVAKLEHFNQIKMCGNENIVDIAIASLNEQFQLNCVIQNIGEPNDTILAQLGMEVEKNGRTTGHTKGKIEATDADIKVGYDNGQKAVFINQIKTQKMSFPGDSGSLLINKQGTSVKAVGLIFAGSNTNSYANHYYNVTNELNANGYYTNFAKSTVAVNKKWLANKPRYVPYFGLAAIGLITTYAYNTYHNSKNKPKI